MWLLDQDKRSVAKFDCAAVVAHAWEKKLDISKALRACRCPFFLFGLDVGIQYGSFLVIYFLDQRTI